MTFEPTKTLTSIGTPGASPERELMVHGPKGLTTHRLPPHGVLTLGRDPASTIRLDDPSVSRNHLALHCGEGLFVEDLGSHNGTLVAGSRLAPNARRPVFAGEHLQVGAFVLVVQRVNEPPPPWDDARFEAEVASGRGGTWARLLVAELKDRLECWRTVARAVGDDGGFRAAPDSVDLWAPAARPLDVPALLGDLVLCGSFKGWASVEVPARKTTYAEQLKALTARLSAASRLATAAAADDVVMHQVDDLLGRVAPGQLPVLLLGETGVGKGVTARELHRRSGREGPFVVVNCAAISEGLLESELFGYERGAFTGADRAKPGLIETANRGSLFLDEIGEMPLSLQAKLLHVLEAQQVQRVGSVTPKDVNVRIISATNRDLSSAVKQRRFREDLYFRLAGLVVELPPLRKRPNDIIALAERFAHRTPALLTPGARAALTSYPWPGNVRELKTVIERGLLLSRGAPLQAEHLMLDPKRAAVPLSPGDDPSGLDPTAQAERQRILDALGQAAGSQTQAAKLLGISRSTLVARIEKYGLPRPRK